MKMKIKVSIIGTVYPITELEHENWFQNRMLDKECL